MLEGLTPNKRRYECAVDRELDRLNDTDKKILLDALADQRLWSAYSLMTALKKRGITMGDKSIRKHRDGVCTCSKT
jgi:hypothetical protein